MIPFSLYVNAIQIVCIALGAAGAFIFDSFFLLSRRQHKVTSTEYSMLQRINLLSLVACSVAMLFFVFEIASYISNAGNNPASMSVANLDLNSLSMKFLLFIIAFMTALTIRKIHLPALRRHQGSYAHLSESFVEHQRSLISTAVYSTVSWMSIIFLSSLETVDGGSILENFSSYNFITLLILYILICYVAEYILFNFKQKFIR